MSWLDVVLGLILLLSVIEGLKKGFAQTFIGFVAVILGIFCGLWFYGIPGGFFARFIGPKHLANLLGFVFVFIVVVVVGAAVAALLEKLMKLARLTWLNRLLGGAFGIVRGVLVGAALVLVLMAFSSKLPPESVAGSRLAPYVMGAARLMADAAPREVRDGFQRSYEKLLKILEEHGRKPDQQAL
ncbi:MAG: CvpA family protein [Bryobacteraceae bacterium]|jgi:membrane protein required for colicin V production